MRMKKMGHPPKRQQIQGFISAYAPGDPTYVPKRTFPSLPVFLGGIWG